ncbi:MAG: LacI family DNA-binding transcriptional regulator [Candidatus Marinimicrobia bacterium]|nr:LacI family DNA-binding transcriptional regulator [Candidatus Neomarinimicrobiota bacterium]
MTITMKDIANKVGVSVVTVSRALNDKPDISRETKDFIKKIAQEFNYTPHGLAKSLVTRKTKTIGIIIPNAKDSFYAEVIDGICNESRERGYGVILCNSNNSADEELKLIRLLREKRVDGMLIYPVQEDNRYIEELKNIPVPFAFLNRHTDQLKCDYVINDNIHGAYSAVNELIKRGYKKITYICAKPTASSGKERIAGCKKAIRENGLPLNALRVMTCEETIESCYNLVKELIVQNKKLSALFVWDDRLAIGAIKAIFEAGLHIPQDVAIVGYDDIEISKYLYPPLTTVRQPTFQIGKTATSILLDKLNSEDVIEVKQIVLKPELVVRDTI